MKSNMISLKNTLSSMDEQDNFITNEKALDILTLKTADKKDYEADNKSLSSYNFSSRALNILHAHHIYTISDLLNHSFDAMRFWRNMGTKTLEEIREIFNQVFELKKDEINIAVCIAERKYKFYKIPLADYHKLLKEPFYDENQFITNLEKHEELAYKDSTNLDVLFILNSFKQTKIFNFAKSFTENYNKYYFQSTHTVASILVCIIKCIRIKNIPLKDILNYSYPFCNLAFSDKNCIEKIKRSIISNLLCRLEPEDETKLFSFYPEFLRDSGILSSVLKDMKNSYYF